jgi:hypothetical protein
LNQPRTLCAQQFLAVFSDFIAEQQPFSHFLPQHEAAVLSFPHPSLQQPAALLSSFMQDLASLPPQQDFISLLPQHEAMSFVSFFP